LSCLSQLKITHDTYLGDIISCDGNNDLNIHSRVAKGHGKVNEIMNILERVTLGSHYVKTALKLRESLFLSSILTNAEVWYGLSDRQVSQLEVVDRLLLRKFLNTPNSSPLEGIQLELGTFSVGTIIKARRINYLRYLLSTSENEMLNKVFIAQWNNPVKHDWTEKVKRDLMDFGIEPNLKDIRKQSINAFKKLLIVKASLFEFSKLMKLKQGHSKMENLEYSKLELQDYLKQNNMNAAEAKTMFTYRTRMASYGENFRENNVPVSCPLCGLHLDNQIMAYTNCPVLKANVQIEGKYEDLFKPNIPTKIVKSLVNIDNFREEHIKKI
jgi:hypothetical protein